MIKFIVNHLKNTYSTRIVNITKTQYSQILLFYFIFSGHLIIQEFLRQKIFLILQNILIWSGKKTSDKSFSTLKLLILIVQQLYKSFTQA